MARNTSAAQWGIVIGAGALAGLWLGAAIMIGKADMERAAEPEPTAVQLAAPATDEHAVTPEQADELTGAICETIDREGADEGSRIIVEAFVAEGFTERQAVATIAVAVSDKCEGALD